MDSMLLQLEILSNGGSLHEVAHIANGSHPRNCISLLRINVSTLYLGKELCTKMPQLWPFKGLITFSSFIGHLKY
jgi:hypothetical protein